MSNKRTIKKKLPVRDYRGLTTRDRAAIEAFDELKKAADAAREDNPEPKGGLMRVARNVDVDYSKAKKNCKHCKGKGVRAYKPIDIPDGMTDEDAEAMFTRFRDEDGNERFGVPIICPCVVDAGGVDTKQLDEMIRDATTPVRAEGEGNGDGRPLH